MSYFIGKHQWGGGDLEITPTPSPLSTKIRIDNHGYKKHLTQFWNILLQLSWNQMLNFNTYNCNYEINKYLVIYIYI
jgi:hypothetical protein